jgi:hypothetical protein
VDTGYEVIDATIQREKGAGKQSLPGYRLASRTPLRKECDSQPITPQIVTSRAIAMPRTGTQVDTAVRQALSFRRKPEWRMY